MKVGFIGLGTMGAGMAANLQKAGYELVVHDIRRASAEKFLAAGAVWADTPKALGEQVEVVFTSLPGPPEVEAVALGREKQLVGHLERALNNGLTKTELSEVITHLAFYAGWPAAMTAALVAKDVFEKH